MADDPGRGEAPPRLAIFDLDGTLTRADSFGPFVLGLLARHPSRFLRLPLLLVPCASYLLRLAGRGELKGAILKLLFGGLARSGIERWADDYTERVVPARMFSEALDALRSHLSVGDRVVLLSASPDLYVPRIGIALGVHESICTEIRWHDNRLDGRLSGENRRGQEKLRVVQRLRQAYPGVPAIAYGNSEADLPHMVECEQAVYVNARRPLARALSARGLRCVHWQ